MSTTINNRNLRDNRGDLRDFEGTVEEIKEYSGAEDALGNTELRFSHMAEIGRVISSSLDIQEVYSHFAQIVSKLIPFDLITVGKVDVELGESTVKYRFGLNVPGREVGVATPLSGMTSEDVGHNGRSLLIQSVVRREIEARYPGFVPVFDAGVRSLMVVPLVSNGKVIGTLHLGSTEPNAYDKESLLLAEGVASQIAGAIANAELFAEHKRVENALAQSAERFKLLLENAADASFVLDSELRIVEVNRAACELTGYTRAELLNMAGYQLRDGATDDEVSEIKSCMVEGVPHREKLFVRRKDGTTVPTEDSVSMVRIGGTPYYLCLMRDLTERQKAEHSLIMQMRETAVLEERNRLARELHDSLAQKLTGIAIQIESAKALLDSQPQIAKSTLDTARELALESLDEARRSVWNLSPMALSTNNLVMAIQDEIVRTQDHGITAELEVLGDQSKEIDLQNEVEVFRIIQESLNNVRRHSRANQVQVILTFRSEDLRLSVVDDGIGFDPTLKGVVLSPSEGGFGLTGMQQRAALAGGHLELTSNPGAGTTINVHIPYQPPDTEYSPSQTTLTSLQRETESPDPIRVVIVDDHELVRQGIRSLLEQHQDLIVIGEASDSDTALDLIIHLSPDVVLMDIEMPESDGVVTLKRLRQLGAETRVILLSVYANEDYIFEGLRAGARGYLLKDVGREELVQAIRTVYNGGTLLQAIITNRLLDRLVDGEGPKLTPREREVMELVESGARNKEIAKELILTESTIKFHVENIYQKLGVQSRTGAVNVAKRYQLLK